MQGAYLSALGQSPIGSTGVLEGLLAIVDDYRVQGGVQPVDAVKVSAQKFHRGDGAVAYRFGQLDCRTKGKGVHRVTSI